MLAARNLTIAARLAGVSAELRPGEVTAICGPNGAGKSTLLASLAGLIAPDAGEVALDGAPLHSLNPNQRAQAIGYLPQSPEIAWDIDVRTLAGLGRLPWRSGAEQDTRAVATALQALDLEQLAHRPVRQLSGGERARALLARVLAGEPRWLLADEPLANLDLAHQLALLGHFRAMANEGRGVVLVLHDLALAMNHADRVVVLDGGRVAADGAPEVALSARLIGQVWGVKAEWIGQEPAVALLTRTII